MLTLTRSDAVDPANPHDDLVTPAGSTIRLAADADLRRQFHNLGISGAHTRPRNQLVSEYAAMLRRVHDSAGAKAVDEFLQSKRI